MVDDWRCRLEVMGTEFADVGRPALLARTNPFKVSLKGNDYGVTSEFRQEAGSTTSEEDGEDGNGGEALASKLFLFFATKENLPHRMAVDLKKYIQVKYCGRPFSKSPL